MAGGSGRAARKQHGITASIARFWQRSYASDYLGLSLLLTAYVLIQFFVEPFHQMFSLDDRRIQHPHAEVERVPVIWLFIYAGIVPLLITVIWAAIAHPSIHKLHVTLLGLFISIMLATFITDVIKNTVGRPRPDLIARCKPEKGTPADALVTVDVCTETDHHVLHDGWRSFPSGHSSFSFSGLGFLALLITGQLHVLRPGTDFFRILIALAPVLGAALIAISRLEDYRHDVHDVTTGSLLGVLVAWFTYRRYFPRLRSPRCDEPYQKRVESGEKLRDEEQRVDYAAEYELDDMEEEEDRRLLNAGVERGS